MTELGEGSRWLPTVRAVTPIHELLARIRHDPEFGRGQFEIGYFDRREGTIHRVALKEIVFPIALRVSLPSWTGLTLGVMKDSALVLWIGVIELLRTSQVIITRIQEPLLVLSVCGLIYFVMSYPISRLGARLEAKWRDLD